jgi:hypothetical protein
LGVLTESNAGDYSHADIDAALVEAGYTFKKALNGMAIANFVLSSDNAVGDYSYAEAEEYAVSSPGIFGSVTFKKGMDTTVTSTSLNRFAAQYITLSSSDPMKCILTPTSSNADDLTLHAMLGTSEGTLTVVSGKTLNIDPARYEIVALAVVSQDTVGGTWDYSISITDGLPDVTGTSLEAGEIRIDSNYPNPFNGNTAFQINIAEAQTIKVLIVNTLGQTVRTVYYGTATAGGTELSWDGRMDSGERAPSGLYLVSAIGKATTAAEKIIYVK